MSNEVAIRVKEVSKNFRLPHERAGSVKTLFMNPLKKGSHELETQHALNKISFEVNKGEFFGIVGRNGSGKSTLLKMLAGIYQPSSGKIQTAGKLVPFIELGVGFNPELSGRENVYLNGALLGFDANEIDQMYDDIVEFAEIERFMDQKLKNYSSGMQVRLAFSMAVRAKADILLIDEVLAVGDSNFQRKCFEYFRQLKRDKKTVVFISHDLAAVEEFCDRAALIDSSELLFVGDTSEAIMKYRGIMAAQNSKDDEPTHSGTGKVKITDFEILQNSRPVSQIGEGESFDIMIKYEASTKIQDPVFGLAIINRSDTIVAGPHTQEAKVSMGTIEGKGHVLASFKENLLSTGSYTFMVSCFNQDLSVPYDFINKAGRLEVLGQQRYGAVNLKPQWSTGKD